MACSKAIPLFLFLGFFMCLSSSVTEAVKPDFYYLSLVWPGSYCKGFLSSCCVPTTGEPAEEFLVEGMFPYDSTTGKPVSNCNSTCKFYVNALQKFIGEMYSYWSDISCPSNNGVEMWKSLWCTYGTCSGLTQRNYFNTTLVLTKTLSLLYVLQDNAIVPSDTQDYSLKDIQSVLMANYGFSTSIECNKDLPLLGKSMLYKVKFCVASDLKTIISCPIALKTNCDAKVSFPSFPDKLIPEDPLKMPTARDVAM